MNILVIGSGGREHALAWKISQSPGVRVYAAPGNGGMGRWNVEVKGSYLDVANAVGADLTVVGPEAPLVDGVVDQFLGAGKLIVGPTAENARLEGSKIFAKDFFRRHRIPTAEFVSVERMRTRGRRWSAFGFRW